MKSAALACVLLASAASQATLVSAWDFAGSSMSPYFYNGFGNSLSTDAVLTNSGNATLAPLTPVFSTESVGGSSKTVVTAPLGDFLAFNHGIVKQNPVSAGEVFNWTQLLDLRLSANGARGIENGNWHDSNGSEVALESDGNGKTLVRGGNNGATTATSSSSWDFTSYHRVVVTSVGDVNSVVIKAYVDGTLAMTYTDSSDAASLYAADSGGHVTVSAAGSQSEVSPVDAVVSQAAYWDTNLSDSDVSKLGQVGTRVSAVPEPASMTIIALGAFAALRRKRS